MKKYTALSLLMGSSLPLVAVEKPNIILIYIDDMGFADLTSYGGQYPTPHIDKLASEGIRFGQYYSACPISSPSRVAVTTGMYPARWGINTFLQTRTGNANAEQNDFLNNRAPSLARTLRQNGYATAHFGKWHMGGGRDVYNAPSIITYGFDEYSSTYESPNPDPKLTSTNWIWADTDAVKRWNRTAYFVDKTLDFLARNKDNKPSYINLWPDDVHTPFVENDGGKSSPQANWEKEASFTVVLTEMDKQIGRLMQGIKDLGLEEETLVIFTSDNGPNPNYQSRRTLNFRGQKAQLYEGGIRMPFITHWPSKIAPNQYNSQSILCSVDLFPSLCAITGTTLPSDFQLDGVDRSSIILGGEHEERPNPLFWQFAKTNPTSKSPHIAIREGDWKLLVDTDGGRTELYNMKTDWLESTNVAGTNATIVSRLKPMAINWFNTSYREFADLNTGSDNTLSGIKIKLFPNPATDHIQIQTSMQDYTTEILGVDGKRLILCEKNSTKTDISSLKPGMYIISIKNSGEKYFEKFIKE